MSAVVTKYAYAELVSVAIAEDKEKLYAAISETIQASLLNVLEVSDQKHYDIHLLTNHFVYSDLPEIWRAQGLL